MQHKNILKSFFNTATATVLSRILGLVRVILEARILGGGNLATAWMFAFTLPNTFRRILGEGALGSALVPFVAHDIEHNGREETRRDITAIFAVLTIILTLISLTITGASRILLLYVEEPRYVMTLQLLPLVMPYVIFICLTGAASAVLNTIKIFFLPALSALILNLALICCLAFICPKFAASPTATLNALGSAVLLAGAIQLIMILILLHRKGMFPELSLHALRRSNAIKSVWKLTLPGVIGGAALQVSTLADKTIACWLGPHAVPALSYSDRIVYLPVGVFAISLGTVLLSDMSASAAKNNITDIVKSLEFSLRIILYICIPISVFIIFFREPVIRLICFGGKFTEMDLQQTSYAMLFYAGGIPAFVCVKLLVPAFHARKQMTTPVKISILCIIINIILNLIFMIPLQQGGIALATVISSILNNILLLSALHRSGISPSLRKIGITLFKSLLCALVAIAVARGLIFQLAPQKEFNSLLTILLGGTIFAIFYLPATILIACQEPRETFNLFKI